MLLIVVLFSARSLILYIDHAYEYTETNYCPCYDRKLRYH